MHIVCECEDESTLRILEDEGESGVGNDTAVQWNVGTAGLEGRHNADYHRYRPLYKETDTCSRSDAHSTKTMSKSVGPAIEVSIGDGVVEMFYSDGMRILADMMLESMVDAREWGLFAPTKAKAMEEGRVNKVTVLRRRDGRWIRGHGASAASAVE
jgi:hypothetical protein